VVKSRPTAPHVAVWPIRVGSTHGGAIQGRQADQAAATAVPDPGAADPTRRRAGNARGAAQGTLAERYVRGFRPWREYRNQQAARCAGRFARKTVVYRNHS